MRFSILIGVLVVFMCSTALADVCGGLDCGAHSCCLDHAAGALCYSASNFSCLELSAGQNKLCPHGQQACGKHCYGNQYVCENGMLCPAGMHACGEACYDSSLYLCSNSVLCPQGTQVCGKSCYDPSAYTCVSGELQQGANNGATSAPATMNPATQSPTSSPATNSPATGAPATNAPATSSPATSASTMNGGKVPVKLWGIDWNPRMASGECPTMADIEENLEILSGVTSRIRLYSIVDCNAAEMILQAMHAKDYNLRLTLGIWLDQYYAIEFENEFSALMNLIDTIGLDFVDAIIVGSETQYRKDFSPSLLINFLRNVTSAVISAGHSDIQIATADVIYNLLGDARSVLNEEDVIYVNQFPFWEGISIENSPEKLQTTVAQLQQVAGNKPIVVSETGWPTCGDMLGESAPGLDNLITNLHDMVCWFHKNNIGYFWFAAFDAPWANAEMQGGVEQCFGLFTADKQLKAGINLPVQCPQ